MIEKNKKGNALFIIMFFVALFVILFIGFLLVVGASILDWVWDTASPELMELGIAGAANMTDIAASTLGPVDTIIQNFTWLTGVLYMMLLIGSFAIVFIIRTSPSKWLIGFYFMLIIILIMGCIFISNMYEEFHHGDDEFAQRLQEHYLLSWMILYSPAIFTAIAFLTGIIMFSGIQQEEFA